MFDPRATPTWIDEVVEALSWPDTEWARTGWPDPVGACNELIDWLDDLRIYAAPQKQAWLSLIHEVQRSLDTAGSTVKTQLLPETRQLKATIQELPPGSEQTRARVREAALQFRMALAKSGSAAWNDLVGACRRGSLRAGRRDELRDLFWAIVELSGRSVAELSRTGMGVMRDRAIDIAVAHANLGVQQLPDAGDWPDLNVAGGLSPEERVGLVADLIVAPPSMQHHIVWLAFAPAELSSPLVSLGSAQLFDGPWLRERVQQSQLEGLPPELKASRDRFSAADLPNHERFVLARIDLGLSRDPNPVESAKADTRALVAAASLKRGRRRWRLMEGYIHAEDGQVVSLGGFYFHEKRDHSIADSTETFLRELATDLGGDLRPSSPEMRAFLVEIDQLQDGVDRNEPSMVLTLIRLIELVNSRATGATETWQQFASRYFEHAWVRQQVYSSLTHLAQMAQSVESPRYFAADPTSTLEQLGKFIEFNTDGTWNAHLDRTFDALPTLRRRARIHSSEGRRLIEIAGYLESTESASRWIESLRKDFRTSLARLKRVRDASTHGGPVTTSVPSALVFCQSLTFGALGWTLDALVSGRSVRDVFEEESRSARDWTREVSSGRSLRSALFGLT